MRISVAAFFCVAAVAAFFAVQRLTPIVVQQLHEYDCIAQRCTQLCAQTATRFHDYLEHAECLSCVTGCKELRHGS